MNIIYYLPILIPSILILFSSIAVLFIDNNRDNHRFKASFFISFVSMIISLGVILYFWLFGIINYKLFSNTLYIDLPGYFFATTALLIGALSLLASKDHIINWSTRASMLSLISLSILGIIYMSFANNIIIILTTWAISSAASYAITMLHKDYMSVDAGIKYLIMGLVSSSLMIIGFASYLVATDSL
ncbi:MAG: NADH-quinone oxidoreductase subunit NuoN, partial [Saccharolobus sp.]